MKCVCFVFLLCYVGSKAEKNSPINWLEKVNGYDVHPDRKQLVIPKLEREYHDHIETPCSIHNIDCIRQILTLKALCSPLSGRAQDSYIIKKLTLDVPHANTSFTISNAAVKGLRSGKIEEFYINKKTDTMVLEVMFDYLIMESPSTTATYYRKGKEPIVASDYSISIFKKLSLSLIVRHVSKDQLSENHVYSYLSTTPLVILGPGLEDITGLSTSILNLKWRDEITLSAQEALVKEGPVFMDMFLQNHICNVKY